MPKSFWSNLPVLPDTYGFALANAAHVSGGTWMDGWHSVLLAELCASMDNKNKYNQHDCISKGWGRAGSNQSKVSRAPNYAPKESSCISLVLFPWK